MEKCCFGTFYFEEWTDKPVTYEGKVFYYEMQAFILLSSSRQ